MTVTEKANFREPHIVTASILRDRKKLVWLSIWRLHENYHYMEIISQCNILFLFFVFFISFRILIVIYFTLVGENFEQYLAAVINE